MQDPSDETIQELYQLGYNLYLSEEYAKSEPIFQRITIARPMVASYWQGYASSLQMQGKYQEALVPWSMCALVDPTRPLPHYHAAECLFSLGDATDGRQALIAAENRDKEKVFEKKIASLRNAWEAPHG